MVQLLMVPVNLITNGAQRIFLPVEINYQKTNYNSSVSVRTQHSGRVKTAILTPVMAVSGCMVSGAGAVSNIVITRHTCNMIMEHFVLVAVCLSVKTRAIRYLKDTHSVTSANTWTSIVTSAMIPGQTRTGKIRAWETVSLNVETNRAYSSMPK